MAILDRPAGQRRYFNAAIVKEEKRKLDGRQFRLTIDDVSSQVVDERTKEEKLVVRFREHKLGLILNSTNFDTLDAAYTADSDRWVGQLVEMYTATTPMGNGVRVRPLPPQGQCADPSPPVPRQQQPAAGQQQKTSDHIPF